MKINADLNITGGLSIGKVFDRTAASSMLVVEDNGSIRKAPYSTPSVIQLADIFGVNYGNISVNNVVQNQIGSYNCRLTLQFGDLSNGVYKLAGQAIVDFSFVAYNAGSQIIHTEPVLQIVSFSAMVVNISTNFVYELTPNHIRIETTMFSNKLILLVKNNLQSPYSGSFRCKYSLSATKWDWKSGGIETS